MFEVAKVLFYPHSVIIFLNSSRNLANTGKMCREKKLYFFKKSLATHYFHASAVVTLTLFCVESGIVLFSNFEKWLPKEIDLLS